MNRLCVVSIYTLLVISFLAPVYAGVSHHIQFSQADLAFEQRDGFDIVQLKGADFRTEEIGYPDLPVKGMRLLLPPNQKVIDIKIVSESKTELSGEYLLYPTQPPKPLNYTSGTEFVQPNSDAYNSSNPYPGTLVEIIGDGYLLGQHVVEVKINPLQYIPVEKKLILHTEILFEVEIEPLSEQIGRIERRTKQNQSIIERSLKMLVENSDKIELWQITPQTIIPDNSETQSIIITPFPSPGGTPVDMVIITSQEFALTFQELADWKTKKGVVTTIRTVEWITENYPGVDPAEKTRNFIYDAYINWGTIWVLLGGDTEIVPHRIGFTAEDDENGRGPTDMYYSDVIPEANWNADGDNIFGEGNDQVDGNPDLYVGRASVEDLTEADIFVNKVLTYEKNPPLSYITETLFMGASLYAAGADGWGQGLCEHIIDTDLPSNFTDYKLYNLQEGVCTWSIYYGEDYSGDELLTTQTAISQLSQGYHLVNHADHSGPYDMGTGYMLGGGLIDRGDVNGLTNGNELSVIFTMGCSPNAFDLNSISESFINNPQGGAVAYIGHSRVAYAGWDYQARTFFHTLFNDVNTPNSGFLFMSAQIALFDAQARRSLNLLGDPEMPVWSDRPLDLNEPMDFLVDYPSSIPNGTQQFTVSVFDIKYRQGPIADALVTIKKDNEDYARGYTDASGAVTFNFTPDTPGSFSIVVTKKNYIPFEGTGTVILTSGAHVYAVNRAVDDNIDGYSDGNSDGIMNPNEIVEFSISLTNTGNQTAYSVMAQIKSDCPHLYIPAKIASYDNIGPGNIAYPDEPFLIEIAQDTPDTTITLTLEMWEQGSVAPDWIDYINIEIKAPQLIQTVHTIDDDLEGESHGDGDGIPELGETIELLSEVKNTGHGGARDVMATLTSSSLNFRILRGQANIGNLASGQSTWAAEPFLVEVRSPHFGLDGESHEIITQFSSKEGQTGDLDNVSPRPRPPQQAKLTLILEDDYSEKWILEHMELTRPSQVSGIRFTSGTDYVNLEWNPSNASDLWGYYVYRSENETGPFSRISEILTGGSLFYDDHEGSPTAVFYYYVTVIDVSGNESPSSETLRTWLTNDYLGDWPIGAEESIFSSPTLLDADGDGDLEIFAASYDGYVYAWRPDGTELFDLDNDPRTVSGFAAIDNPGTNEIWASPAVGDIDNDGIMEVVIASRGVDKKVYVWKNCDGDDDDDFPDVMPGWPTSSLNGLMLSSPVLYDLDNDGDLEIIVITEAGRVYVWHHNGTQVGSDPGGVLENHGNGIYTTAAVGDINRDGYNEIIFGDGIGDGHFKLNSVTLKPMDQHTLPIWEYTDAWPVDIGAHICGSPAIGNLDGDIELEVVTATSYDLNANMYEYADARGKVFVFEHDGTAKWEEPWHSGSDEVADIIPSPALAELSGENENNGPIIPGLEVVMGTNKGVRVWRGFNHDLLLDIDEGAFEFEESSPIVADIDGDNEYEIVKGLDNELYAWNLDGSPVERWPTPTGGAIKSTAAIGNLTGNGTFDIVSGNMDNQVYIWDLTNNQTNLNIQWGMFHHDPWHTGQYGFTPTSPFGGGPQTGANADGLLPKAFSLSQNLPNPFKSVTKINYALANSAKVSLRVYNILGQEVRVLENSLQQPGYYSVTWDGKDQRDRNASHGIYFITMSTDEFEATIKVLFLR